MKIRFGTSGWRAVISDQFTFSNVKIVSQAIAEYVKKMGGKTLIVARDTRFMTEHYAQLVAQVLAANGIKVLMPENPTPTPVVSFAIRHYGLSGGINITASHNPPEYCGIKFNPADGSPASPEITKQIESLIEKIDESKVPMMSIREASAKELFEIFEPRADYMKAIAKKVDLERIKSAGLKVIADLLYGTAAGYLDDLCKSICGDFEVFHNYRNPYFGGGRPEPDETRLREFAERVKNRGWDVVVATDGDADRFGIVDDTGDFVKPNEVIALLAHHLYKNKNLKGPVARTVATSHALDAVAHTFNEKVIETPVGFKFLAATLLSENVVIAGEESGGLTIQNHTPEKDGILACLLILEMMAYEKKALSEIREEFRRNYGEFFNTRIDFELKDEKEKQELLTKFKNIKDYLSGIQITDQDSVDGMRYFFDRPGAWMLARASGTEPVVRIYLEAKDTSTLQSMITAIRKLSR
ncbi:phosphoglucomutase/phosphomannomutase family protein [Pseudothermotoga sp. U03pept]|uniref:phosphoglucomutase/phosphomannomutase family protein n=1 Tax=Pseudothermotoga sp. U03pept TaxID=3447012 RepID=UPI003EFFAEF7